MFSIAHQVTRGELVAARDVLLHGSGQHAAPLASIMMYQQAAATAVPRDFDELVGDDAEVNESLREMLMGPVKKPMLPVRN